MAENNPEGIYLDNNATTQVDPEIVAEMLPYFTEQYGNPSSMHQFGNKVGHAIKKARSQIQATFAVHFQEMNRIAIFFEILAQFQHRWVFDGGGDDFGAFGIRLQRRQDRG